jgi:hypothetical protein
MEGNRSFPVSGENDIDSCIESNAYETPGEEDRELISNQLHDLADQLHEELHELADLVRAGTSIEEERSEAIRLRARLTETDRLLCRRLDGVPNRDLSEIERDPRERSHEELRDRVDVDRLRDPEAASTEEIARRLRGDLDGLLRAADRVDRALYRGDLTDVLVSDLWSRSALLEAWSREILTHRTDRRLRYTREEAEALDRTEEIEVGEETDA